MRKYGTFDSGIKRQRDRVSDKGVRRQDLSISLIILRSFEFLLIASHSPSYTARSSEQLPVASHLGRRRELPLDPVLVE